MSLFRQKTLILPSSISRPSVLIKSLHLEQLEDRRLLALVGDAPAPYPAAGVSNATGATLGDTRTVDDGVRFQDIRVGEVEAVVFVDIASAGSGTVLDAWIDFNRDGSFGGAHEQILDSVTVINGDGEFTVEIPSWASDGLTYARFRLSQGEAAGLPQGGLQDNGEIEDYQVVIEPPFFTEGLFGSEDVIEDSRGNGVVDVLTIDIDLDGDMDVVSSSHIDGEIAIYRANTFFSSWSRSLISDGGFVSGTGNASEVSAVRLAAGDLDGDGDIDLVSASSNDDTIAWYENLGNAASFIPREITDQADGARAVVVVDLDRDGRLDIASLSLFDNTLRIHENTGSSNKAQLFDTETAILYPANIAPADLKASDIDNDGWDDLITITAATNRIVWHRNDTTPFNAHGWFETTIYDGSDQLIPNGTGIFTGDINNDGDIDVVATSYSENRVDWYENQGNGNCWSGRRVISTSVPGANLPFVADIDGDGDLDVLTPAYNNNTVYFHANNGGGAFLQRDTVSMETPTSVAVANINGDGSLDIVAGGHDNDQVSWWENPLPSAEIVVRGNNILIDDNDTTPRTADGTHLGTVTLGGSVATSIFTIHNTGSGTLSLGSVTVPTGFTLVSEPARLVPPGGSTSMLVQLDTAIPGQKDGDVRFASSDGNENPYDFAIRGVVGVALPGNYNNDLVVDRLDYLTWKATFGDVGGNLPADGNGNGVVDLADYTIWRNNLGATATIAAISTATEQSHSSLAATFTAPAIPRLDAGFAEYDSDWQEPTQAVVPTQPTRHRIIESSSGKDRLARQASSTITLRDEPDHEAVAAALAQWEMSAAMLTEWL